MNLNIIEIFASVQGETSLTGLPTTFIRLASCNLRCSWCDTAYSFGRGTPYSIESILEQTEKNGCRNACITGGEPLLQENVYALMDKLIERGYVVSLETGGSLSIAKVPEAVITILDIKCPGSGMDGKNLWSNLGLLTKTSEVKFVIADKNDYEYAKRVCSEYELYGKVKDVLFSPVFNVLEPRALVEWILSDKLPVRLNLQTHKFIWEPATRGV